MSQRAKQLKASGLTLLGSFLFLLVFMSLTNPVNNISYSIVVFLGFLVFLISLGFFFIKLQNGQVSPKNRSRIFIVSFLLVVSLMLRSAQGLNLNDGFIVLLIAFGLLFYASRRSQ